MIPRFRQLIRRAKVEWLIPSTRRAYFALRGVIIVETSYGAPSFDAQARHVLVSRVHFTNSSSVCHISVHPRCVNQVYVACSQQPPRRDDAITQARECFECLASFQV